MYELISKNNIKVLDNESTEVYTIEVNTLINRCVKLFDENTGNHVKNLMFT